VKKESSRATLMKTKSSGVRAGAIFIKQELRSRSLELCPFYDGSAPLNVQTKGRLYDGVNVSPRK